MEETPDQPQPPVSRPSLVRDIYVQAVGSALGVGLVVLVGVAYGFIEVQVPSNVLRGTLAVAVYLGIWGLLGVLLSARVRLPISAKWRLILAAVVFLAGAVYVGVSAT